MFRSGYHALLLAALLATAALPLRAESAPRGVRHDFDAEQCRFCHPQVPNPEAGESPPLAERIDAQCAKCHTPCGPWTTHGTGRNVPARMKTELPRGSSGTIECFTCHLVHTPPEQGSWSPDLLRMVNIGRELCLNCHQERTPGRIAVVTPPPGVTVRDPELLFAGSASAPEEELYLRINDATFPLPVKDGTFSTWLTLSEGVNTVQIVHDSEVRWETLVYRIGDGKDEDMVHTRLHRGHLTGRGECPDCHGDTGQGYRGVAMPTASALCYRCHDRFDEKRFIHGPVAVGACLSCHDPHGGVGEGALLEDPASLCLSCHTRGDVTHCVTDPRSGDPTCVACHDPHQSDAQYFTRGESSRPRRTPR